MNISPFEYTYYFLILLLVLAASYFLGTFYLKFYLRRKSITTLNNFFAQFSERMLFGLTIIISLTATLCTMGLTVQWFSILALLSLKFFLPQTDNNLGQPKEEKTQNRTKADIGFFFFLTTLVFVFHVFASPFLYDHVWYGKVSASIFKNGVEHIDTVYSNYQEIGGINFYHFAELWLNGLIAKTFSLNHVFVNIFVVYPIYHLLVLVLFIGFFREKYSLLTTALYSFSILYGSAILFVFFLSPDQGHHTFWYYGIPDITAFKCLPLYPFILLGFHFLKINNWQAFATLLLIGVVNYITLLPALFGSASVFLLYQFFLKKNKKAAGSLVMFLFAAVSMLGFVLVVNKFFPSVEDGGGGIIHYIYPIKHYFTNIGSYISLFFNYFGRPIYSYPFVTLGVIYLWRRGFTQEFKTISLFVFFSFLVASLFITFFFNYKNGTQSLSMIIPPAMIYLSYLLFEQLNKMEAKFVGIALFVVAILNFNAAGTFDNFSNNANRPSEALLNFAENELKDQKWAYYSVQPWSTWDYNNLIVGNPILLADQSILPLEIAPYFREEKDRLVYLKKNPDYPLRSIYLDKEQRVSKLVNYLISNDINYVFFENSQLVNKEFLNRLEPVVAENKSGIWMVKKLK
jgi:hypothetical protein